MNSRDPDFLPSGHELVRFEPGFTLILPKRVVPTIVKDVRRRIAEREAAAQQKNESADEAKRREVSAPGDNAAKKRPSDSDRTSSALDQSPEPGRYRVVPKLATYIDELASGAAGRRSMDRDRAERRTSLLEELVEKGPDRQLAHNHAWRSELAELEEIMPNFRGPTQLLRDSLSLAEVTGRAVGVPPMLLVGDAGLGKTYFSHRVAEVLKTSHGRVDFDQPTGGVTLRGLDKMWANAETGLLFNLVCLGDLANPLVLLDEVDKAGTQGDRAVDPLSQLLGALEPETARRMNDIAVDVEFDASLVGYIATANSAAGLSRPLLSRLEVFHIERPRPADTVRLAEEVFRKAMERLGLSECLRLERRAVCLLAHMTPRAMTRAVERAASLALDSGRDVIGEDDVWQACEPKSSPGLH